MIDMLIGCRGHDYGRGTPQEIAAKISAGGWEAAQVAPQKLFAGVSSFSDFDERAAVSAGEAFGEAGLKIPVLGCYVDTSCEDNTKRSANVASFVKCLELAPMMGAFYVGTETGGFRGSEQERAKLFACLIDSVKRFADAAEKYGSFFAIEPGADHVLCRSEMVLELIEAAGTPRMRLIFDPVNLLSGPEGVKNIECQKEYFSGIFRELGRYISVFHIKDAVFSADGQPKQTLLGEGSIDYGAITPFLSSIKELSVLREHAVPAAAKREIDFIHEIFSGN